ncbi:MAG TPA: CHAD domain-containing protein [Anaeromyxobacteraceae bacterium]|nr:CHAD domain-containing protein [Anaeromyxobacteraceae bacterium]
MRIEDDVVDRPAEEGARLVALALLEEAEQAADRLERRDDEEALHDFRVAIRQLRSTLRAFRPWLQDGVKRKHEKRLKAVAHATNAARDAEVQLAWLASKEQALAPARLRSGVELLKRRFRERAGGDHARVVARWRAVARKLDGRLGTYQRRVDAAAPGGGSSLGGVLATLVADQLEAMRDRLAAIGGPGDREVVHRTRIEGKRLRYLLEPLRGHRHADASDAVKSLKRLQDVLGDLHDAHVHAEEVGEALVAAAGERARRLHAAVYEEGGGSAALRDELRGSARPGLLAVARLVRERRDALYADLQRTWMGSGFEALAAEVRAIAGALEARAGGKLERERKYLLSAVPPRALSVPALEIAQGWLPGSRLRERIRRVRAADGHERYWRGLKQGSGRTRLEQEEETTREVFDVLWPLTEGRRISKRRRVVEDGGLAWEVDEFEGRGLVVAEVELPARAGEPPLPDWLRPLVVRDVTDDPAFLNENLAAAPPPAAGDGAADAPGDGATQPRAH